MSSHGDGKTRNPVTDLRTQVRLRFDPEETSEWEQATEREIDEGTWRKFEGYVSEIFSSFGMDLHTPGTERTPERFLRALLDSTAGMRVTRTC